MRLVQFEEGGRVRVGVELGQGGDVVDLCAADATIPRDMRNFLKGGEDLMKKADKIVSSSANVLKRSEVLLKAPITRPEKIILVCNNTYEHVEEQGLQDGRLNHVVVLKSVFEDASGVRQPKEDPCLLNKFPSCIIGPGDDVRHPGESVTSCLDWEIEMAMVIGKRATCIKESDVMNHVAGFTIINDVTARDVQLQRNGGQMSMGKSLDTFCPIGPAIVTKDDIIDPFNLHVQLKVNDQVMQDGNTSNYIFKAEQAISFISRMITLNPGDVVSLGTFAGIGYEMKPQRFLKPGDVMECTIDGIGVLRNQVV